MRAIAVLQARMTSSRLPGKSLMQIGGLPMAVLAAKRAGNTGLEVIVATSNDPSDDELARVIEHHGLRCFRGSLEDTLDRFLGALAGMPNDMIVLRLTGDNVLPDGKLLDEMREEFESAGLKYLVCNGEPSGLPYGAAAEVFRASDLRAAQRETPMAGDREHVTPALIRRHGRRYFQRYLDCGHGGLRSTVDTLADYLRVAALFHSDEAVVEVPMMDLVLRLAATRGPRAGVQKLIVGTAQFGQKYGIVNTAGPPSLSVAKEILATAISAGVRSIDTARSYGNSEDVLGEIWSPAWAGEVSVVTKLSPLDKLWADPDAPTVGAFVDSDLVSSLVALGVARLDTVLLHRAEHLTRWGGAAWARLRNRRNNGAVGALGVSVQTPQELVAALADDAVAHVQLPFNILDWRWNDSVPLIRATKAKRPLTVHSRSALLQGLLLSTEDSLWRRANVEDAAPIIGWLRTAKDATGSASVADLCLSYVRTQDWIDGVVVGMETVDQAKENVDLFSRPLPDAATIEQMITSRPRVETNTLDPSQWTREI